MAIDGRIDIAVTPEAHGEVSTTPDETERRNRLDRLRAFKTLALPQWNSPLGFK